MATTSKFKNYFAILPREVRDKILKYLTLEDYFNFCAAVKEFKNFKTIKKIDFARCYKIDIEKLPPIINCDAVTCVNLNHCHWISKTSLHDFILQLPNVKILSALDTKLNLTGDDVEVLNKTKIQRLAVSLSEHKGTKCSLQKVTELYLEIDEATLDYFEEDFYQFVRFPNVEKVWVRFLAEFEYGDCRPLPKHKWLLNCNDEKLKYVTFWLRGRLIERFHGFTYHNQCNYIHWLHRCGMSWPQCRCDDRSIPKEWGCFRKCYESADFIRSKLVCYENSIHDSESSVPYREWNVFDGRNFIIPFVPKDAMKLYSGEESLETMKCKELLIRLGDNTDIYSKILKAQAGSIESIAIDSGHRLFGGISILKGHNLINLKRLALFLGCCLDSLSIVNDDLHYISNFTLLKFLHTNIPDSRNGSSFLPVVLKSCTSLEQLSLTLNVQGDIYLSKNVFMTHLNQALGYANNLKELFLQSHAYYRYEIEDIISILNCNKQIKLVKLKMMVDKCKNLNADIWKEYFEQNEQLMDCMIRIRSLDAPNEKIATELCKLYERPYRKLQIGQSNFSETELELDIFDNAACSLKIDYDFFIL